MKKEFKALNPNVYFKTGRVPAFTGWGKARR
jgi:hypothetical protein